MVPSHESGWFKLTINPIFCLNPYQGFRAVCCCRCFNRFMVNWENTSIFFIRYKVWIVSVNSGRIICDTYEGTSSMLTPPFFGGLYKPVLVGVLTSYTYPVDVLSRPISFFFVRRPNTSRMESLTGLHNITVFSTNKFSTSWTF